MFYRTLEDFKMASGYTIDGFWYPRVTQIVSMKAKPGLYKFYAEQESFEAGEAMKAKSAEEGTLIHETVEAILSGRQPVIPENIRPVIDAFMNFLNHNQVSAKQIEERLVSKKHRYSGTLDVLAEVNGQLGVLDIKTSYSIYRDYGIQTAAYVEALIENGLPSSMTRWILRLDQHHKCLNCPATLRLKGGTPKIRVPSYAPPSRSASDGHSKASEGKGKNCQHQWSEMVGEAELKELPGQNHDFSAFLACKTLWEWENQFWLSRIR
ncbi:MAG: Uncharacterized protein G01um101444_85 [Parcubacteria group bacterium Gr01-1014_44]|nr:MAG: Uncharacterized protein G01um101444_85 [Parcubacteria group bacterium Gr01-1014_44]